MKSQGRVLVTTARYRRTGYAEARYDSPLREQLEQRVSRALTSESGAPSQNSITKPQPEVYSFQANVVAPLKGDFERMARRRFQRGTVFLRGKREPVWVGQWRESVIGPDGNEKRVPRKEILGTTKDFPTKRLAQRELERRLTPVNSLTYRGLRSAKFAQFADTWITTVLPNLRPSTQPPMKSHIHRWLKPYFGETSMRDIGPLMMQSFIQGVPLSVTSKKNLIVTMKIMWNSATAWSYVNHDPFTGLVLPDYNAPEQPHFSVEQVKQIISMAKPPYNVAFWLLFETGIRRGEVCALNVAHVDVPNRIIMVRSSRFGKHITANKSRRPRIFSLSPQLAERLGPMVEGRAADDPLFITPKRVTKKGKILGGKRLHPDNFVKRELKPIVERLGIEGALHAFRHGIATELDRLNVPMKLRQERLGHVESATTMGYTHLVSADDRLLSEKLGEILMPNDAKLEVGPKLEEMQTSGVQ